MSDFLEEIHEGTEYMQLLEGIAFAVVRPFEKLR